MFLGEFLCLGVYFVKCWYLKRNGLEEKPD
jgi:hypothetical protein